MTDLRVREAPEGEWDMPVVELIEAGRVVGIAYLDDIELLAEFYPDTNGEPWSFDVADLQRALDTAQAMLLPEGTDALEGGIDIGDRHPVDVLAADFDDAAALRGEEDEGFYPRAAVAAIIRRSSELDLAVVSLEGVRVHEGWAEPLAGHAVDIGDAHDGDPWPAFKAGCNVFAGAVIERWPANDGFAIAVEVADRDGDRFVL
jgi:hypothetical protein